ncbi:BglG family transcription antiterminator [Spirochaeta lutea]|uniref:PTS EIIB type-2 domain-containing protein n=1 Tax=Spirochaeta lutea TaxID=1480694 RepID=A0A098QSY0_9SPIO|nr:HTH domain-containing protein [Spirochaeta lutea]KGE70975.1 hypothetical protein DC28_13655 [Spirochaeta lutea]
MKDRQKQILQLLVTSESLLKIEDIARTFSIGRRTVSRDLDTLERWLSLRGVVLERKPSQGVRINSLGKDMQSLLSDLHSRDQFIETLAAPVRQNLILLYLLFANREVKISEIANTFFVSDTSVWKDLHQIDQDILPLDLQLDRMKGVGIRLSGPEQTQRLHFIRVLTRLFSSRTIIPFLYGRPTDPDAAPGTPGRAPGGSPGGSQPGRTNRNDPATSFAGTPASPEAGRPGGTGKKDPRASVSGAQAASDSAPHPGQAGWDAASVSQNPGKPRTLEEERLTMILRRMQFPEHRDAVMSLIHRLSEAVGYQFTMSGEVLLFFYLQLSYHRIKSGALVNRLTRRGLVYLHTPDHPAGHPGLHLLDQTSRTLQELCTRFFNGRLPEEEAQLLAVILTVQEVGDSISDPDFETLKRQGSPWENAYALTPPEVLAQGRRIAEEFGQLDRRLYYLNEELIQRFSHSMAALCTRITYGIPYWHGDWGRPGGEHWHRREKTAVLTRTLRSLGITDPDPRDVEYLLLHFQALANMGLEGSSLRPRCLVCCFEGIGLAAYLQTILSQEFPELDLVESTAVYKIRQSYLEDHHIDLVLSTFPIEDIKTPVIPIELPLNRQTIQNQVSRAIQGMQTSLGSSPPPSPDQALPAAVQHQPDFQTIWGFINGFRVLVHSGETGEESLLHHIARSCTRTLGDCLILEGDLNARELLGPLHIPELDLRIFHCKSRAVTEPQAGIITQAPQNPCLYLLAPNPCPESQRRLLSRVTVSLIESPAFAKAILSGEIHTIRRELLTIYRDLL